MIRFNLKGTRYTAQGRNAMMAIALALIFLSYASSLYAQDEEWNIKKSKHFIVYYREVPTEYAGKVTREAERYYKKIIDYLGFSRLNFWTWEKRCKIYLYSSREEYLETTDAESWSDGRVHVIKKVIVTYTKDEQFFDYILPHEMGHIIFREAVGHDKNLPLWIDEGVAILQEKDREKYLSVAAALIKEKSFIPLNELSGIRGYSEVSPIIFYSESASIMEFLLERFSRRRFVIFCRSLRDGTGWKEALLKTYKFESLEELQRAWIASI